MILATPYIGCFGQGYAIISPHATISAGEAPNYRVLGRVRPAHISTERMDAMIVGNVSFSVNDSELEDVSRTLEDKLTAFLQSEDHSPERIDWASFAEQVGRFGLAYIERHPEPTLYGIEADSGSQRVERFNTYEGAMFFDEAQTLLSPGKKRDTISRFTGGILDDQLRQLTRKKPWASLPLTVVYATDLGSFSEQIEPTS